MRVFFLPLGDAGRLIPPFVPAGSLDLPSPAIRPDIVSIAPTEIPQPMDSSCAAWCTIRRRAAWVGGRTRRIVHHRRDLARWAE